MQEAQMWHTIKLVLERTDFGFFGVRALTLYTACIFQGSESFQQMDQIHRLTCQHGTVGADGE